jgi:hypothetical protein
MDDILGRVVAVSGSQMRADVTADQFAETSIRIGSMLKVRSADREVVGTISAAEVDSHGPLAPIVLIVDLLGEIVPSAGGPARFHRGVSCHPIPGAPVRPDLDSRTGFRHREWQKCWRLIKPGR